MGNFISSCLYTNIKKIYPLDEFYVEYNKIIYNLMPTWYIGNVPAVKSDFLKVRDSWNLIIKNKIMMRYKTKTTTGLSNDINLDQQTENNNIIKFNEELQKYESVICNQQYIRNSFDVNSLKIDSCIVWFFTEFYTRLFDIHPELNKIFKSDILIQGHKLTEMMNFCFNIIDKDQITLRNTLKKLVEKHAQFGVQPNHYRIMFDNLLKTLEKVLGPEHFNYKIKYSWVKVLSQLLGIIIPIAVCEDMKIRYQKPSINSH